jgi:hypothetical protein
MAMAVSKRLMSQSMPMPSRRAPMMPASRERAAT